MEGFGNRQIDGKQGRTRVPYSRFIFWKWQHIFYLLLRTSLCYFLCDLCFVLIIISWWILYSKRLKCLKVFTSPNFNLRLDDGKCYFISVFFLRTEISLLKQKGNYITELVSNCELGMAFNFFSWHFYKTIFISLGILLMEF